MKSSPNRPTPDTNNGNGSSAAEPIDEPIDVLLDLLLDGKVEVDSPSAQPKLIEQWDLLSETSEQPEVKSAESFNESSNIVEEISEQTEIEVEIEQTEPTLKEAVEYKAFLRQTATPKKIKAAQQLAQDLDTETASTEDLAEAVNTLIPLVVELLQFKLNVSQEGIIQTVRPVIDRLIEERTVEDLDKMAVAIAKVLPSAIRQGINLTPEEIARAIAPEIALSIREQIRLDADAISQTLGPEMGKAIKAQIELERDAMVDALYPVIGNTISKYMVEVVREINRKVETTLSPAGIKRKIKAKIQGVSEAELIFQESVGYHVRAIFLIDKDSGLIIQEIQVPGEKHLDAEMIAGMLTAIRSFANDCITTGSELDLIDYGDWQIPLEVAGYCYLAVVVAGEPPPQFIAKIRQVLGQIVIEHGKAIQKFDGNLADVPLGVKHKLEQLIEPIEDQPSEPSPILLWLLIFVLGIVFIPWGIISYRARVARNIEQTVAVELDAAPELSVYRLDSQVRDGTLTISGRVPSEYLRRQAAVISGKIAEQNELELDNRIFTVNVPVDPSQVTGEIERLTDLFNQQPQVAIATDYQPKTLTVKGFILEPTVRQNIYRTFKQIPGVEQVIFNTVEQLPTVGLRVYFELNSSQLNFADNFSKINAVRKLLEQYPQLHLKLTVHSDGRGSSDVNRRLGRERCQKVKAALVARGIKPARLITNCNTLILPDNSQSEDALWSDRYVSFEPFIPTNLSP